MSPQHLKQWQTAAVTSKQERESENETVQEAVSHLLRLKVVRMLRCWRAFAEEEFSERMREARAARHYHQLLQHRVFMAWKDRHMTMIRKRVLKVQCGRFENSRLLSSCYVKWRWQVSFESECGLL